MNSDFASWRSNPRELERTASLLELMPKDGRIALDVGARDGYLSVLLTERFAEVIALDLEKPKIEHRGVTPVQGDATKLAYPDNSFDLVVCAEVLEHIPPDLLPQVCHEISRVAREAVVIGVPFEQDLRADRTTCGHCGNINPPWGHVNSFSKERLLSLFSQLTVSQLTFVGSTTNVTNALSAALMDFAGNPYGTYDQEEHCLSCNGKLSAPEHRSFLQKVATKLAVIFRRVQRMFVKPRANWIHIRFDKTKSSGN